MTRLAMGPRMTAGPVKVEVGEEEKRKKKEEKRREGREERKRR
jgi:hypothetical protein